MAAKARQLSAVSKARLSMKSFRIKKLSSKTQVKTKALAEKMGRNIHSAYERAASEFNRD